jgi:hypothetical protein
MGVPLADVAWWAPIAIIGGAVAGAVVGYLLLVATSPARHSADTTSASWQRTDKTNYPSWNPAAFLTVGAVIALVVGLSLGLSLD